MKVVLVQPLGKSLSRVPPLGLGYLAAMLKRRGFEVEISDLNVESSTAFEESLSRDRPEVVGVSCAIGNAHQALAVVSKVKTHFPGCFVVVGGPYACIMGEAMLVRHREIDAAVVGEGEVTFVELLERLQNKDGLSDVNGLIFRDGSKIRSNSLRDPVEALDSLPFPAREKLPMDLYGENAVSFSLPGVAPISVFFVRVQFLVSIGAVTAQNTC